MTKILFVCHGNICRSPMAQCVFTQMVKELGREKEFQIDSMATSYEEHGNPIYPPARRIMHQHGVKILEHYATRMDAEDYHRFDYIIGMDASNMRNMRQAFGGDPEGKLSLLLDHCGRGGDVADPWYTGDFDATWHDVNEGCRAILDALKEQHNW